MTAPDIDGGETALDAALDAYYPSKGWRNSNKAHYRAEMNRAITAYQAAVHPAPSAGNGPSRKPLADSSQLPRDMYVVSADQLDQGIAYDATMCSVPMVVGPEVRYVRADLIPALSAENEGGADYEAKAQEMSEECNKLRTTEPEAVSRQAAKNERGADYEAKARQTTDWILGFMEDECSLLPECVDWADRSNIANAIVNALAQSAADERKRCEAIARAVAGRSAELDNATPFQAGDAIAAAIAARAETKGEGR